MRSAVKCPENEELSDYKLPSFPLLAVKLSKSWWAGGREETLLLGLIETDANALNAFARQSSLSVFDCCQGA